MLNCLQEVIYDLGVNKNIILHTDVIDSSENEVKWVWKGQDSDGIIGNSAVIRVTRY
jgi:hypothetical protein